MPTPADFRAAFPEFTDSTVYTDPQVLFWFSVADKLLNAERWYDLIDQGKFLFTAHHLVIALRDQKSAAAGGVAGGIQGAVSSKSVDKVSVAYDNSRAQYDDAGFWNLTTYGLQYWNLVKMVGAGGIQL